MRSSTSAQQLSLALSLFLSLGCSILALATFLHLISFCAKGVARPRPVQRFVAFCFCFACTDTGARTYAHKHTHKHCHSHMHTHSSGRSTMYMIILRHFCFSSCSFLQTPNNFFFCVFLFARWQLTVMYTHTRARKKNVLKCIPISAFS